MGSSPALSQSVQRAAQVLRASCDYSATWVVVGVMLMVNLLLYILIVNWSIRLDRTNCACSKDWRRTFAVWYPPLAAVAGMLAVVSSLPARALLGVGAVLLVGWVVLCVGALTYLRDLVRRGCMCAKRHTIGDEALEVFAALKIAVILAAALTLGLTSGMGAHVLTALQPRS